MISKNYELMKELFTNDLYDYAPIRGVQKLKLFTIAYLFIARGAKTKKFRHQMNQKA